MEYWEELIEIKNKLLDLNHRGECDDIKKPLDDLRSAVDTISKSFSKSWIGYHSRVYYRDFQLPPANAYFDSEWGFLPVFSSNLRGDWVRFSYDDVKETIFSYSDAHNIQHVINVETSIINDFEKYKMSIISLLNLAKNTNQDQLCVQFLAEIDELKLYTIDDVINMIRPQRFMTRDNEAANAGLMTPPHIEVLANIMSIQHTFGVCLRAANIAENAASHIKRSVQKKVTNEQYNAKKIFIGHGQSPLWRELKDFIQDRLDLQWDEFNREPIAGQTTVERLSKMLDSACFAFLIMTAEDETSDGKKQARMNVIHEVGLFQGRLGVDRAIVLLEEGCEEFSNIHGLGQIRFPKCNISAKFEEIRKTLESANVIK